MRRPDLDNLAHLVNCAVTLARRSAYSIVARISARWWGVLVGPGCSFLGMPMFRRHPQSSILIGAHCQFRSAVWSNLVGINRPCIISTLDSGARVSVGNRCGFSGTVIAAAESIAIGDRVMCGANVTITDTDWHAIDPGCRFAGEPGRSAAVVIESDVWIGMNVTVLKGVTIGAGTVVGAGSVVTRSLPPGVIAAGQPALPLRRIAATASRSG
jgi:acetyltransferase-like isoleucine patch superfamily enzyme